MSIRNWKLSIGNKFHRKSGFTSRVVHAHCSKKALRKLLSKACFQVIHFFRLTNSETGWWLRAGIFDIKQHFWLSSQSFDIDQHRILEQDRTCSVQTTLQDFCDCHNIFFNVVCKLYDCKVQYSSWLLIKIPLWCHFQDFCCFQVQDWGKAETWQAKGPRWHFWNRRLIQETQYWLKI